LGSVQISSIAEHDQGFVGHQDYNSARKTTIRYFCSAD